VPAHPAAIAVILVALALFFVFLSGPLTFSGRARVFAVSLAVLTALIGLGAVFGKTLGDFLRNSN
jgi:hypothetical protein